MKSIILKGNAFLLLPKNLDVVKTFIFNHRTRPDFLMGPFRCQSALSGYCWLRAGNALVEYFVVSGYHIEGSGMT